MNKALENNVEDLLSSSPLLKKIKRVSGWFTTVARKLKIKSVEETDGSDNSGDESSYLSNTKQSEGPVDFSINLSLSLENKENISYKMEKNLTVSSDDSKINSSTDSTLIKQKIPFRDHLSQVNIPCTHQTDLSESEDSNFDHYNHLNVKDVWEKRNKSIRRGKYLRSCPDIVALHKTTEDTNTVPLLKNGSIGSVV